MKEEGSGGGYHSAAQSQSLRRRRQSRILCLTRRLSTLAAALDLAVSPVFLVGERRDGLAQAANLSVPRISPKDTS